MVNRLTIHLEFENEMLLPAAVGIRESFRNRSLQHFVS